MRTLICIACPMGCKLTIEEKDGQYIIEGHKCKRGLEYGMQEMTDPRRHISSTARVIGGFLQVIPVKTDRPIPKGKIFDVMKEINKIKVSAPVQIGQVLIENVAGTGSNIVTRRSLLEAENTK